MRQLAHDTPKVSVVDLSEMLENLEIIERRENPGQAKEGASWT
jgi:hypothetical protein